MYVRSMELKMNEKKSKERRSIFLATDFFICIVSVYLMITQPSFNLTQLSEHTVYT